MAGRIRVTTNNDIAYIWWSVPAKIPGALGFSVHRELEDGTTTPLPAWVGFEKVTKPQKRRDTDVWPVQSFQWKDVLAPRTGKFRYRIYVVRGSAAHPVRDQNPILTTPWAELAEQFGPVRVVFNRGLLSTQALNRGSNAPAANATALRKAIGTKNDKTRLRLARELLPTLYDLLRRPQTTGGKCYAALYELTDTELIDELAGAKKTELVLSNANSSKTSQGKTVSVYDGTNASVRRSFHQSHYSITDRLLKGNSIGHNKFVIYEDSTGPASVLTGSTNWTPTGLCGQTNNAVLIDDRPIATHYRDYWGRLQTERQTLQGAPLRAWTRAHPFEAALANNAKLKVWFSPNTAAKTKPKNAPVDIQEVFDLIDSAKHAVLFLLFNPGKPSIIERIGEAEQKLQRTGQPLYVRGAISDAKTAREGAVRVFSRSAAKADKVITGAAGVPDDFGYWERELLKLGHAAIHDKVLVVDPFSPGCAVVTGSHNLGYKASSANDENMVIIRGHQPIAEAFATHVLDVVNHYKWRYKLQAIYAKTKKLNPAWQDLDEDDHWQDKYFDSGFLASRDAFVLAGSP